MVLRIKQILIGKIHYSYCSETDKSCKMLGATDSVIVFFKFIFYFNTFSIERNVFLSDLDYLLIIL